MHDTLAFSSRPINVTRNATGKGPVMDTLVSTDRCDRCGAQAYVRLVNLTGLQLDFCAHHYNEYGEALNSKNFTISIDNTDILTRRAVGAEVS